MRKLFFAIAAIVFKAGLLQGQPGWNWPEEGTDLWDLSQEHQAYYKVNFQLEEWEKALGSLHWLYTHNPDLHPSIYKDGVKIMEEVIESDISEERKASLTDSLIWTFDQRMKYFDEGGEVIDRKAYSAFKYYYKDPKQYPFIDELFEQAYATNGANISTFILTPYMSFAKFYHQVDPEEMYAEKVLEIHARISESIDTKRTHGTEDAKRLDKEQDKVDAMLSSTGNILSCDFISTQLVPRFEVLPEDLNLAKKIFTYSLKAKCSDQPFFVDAAELVYKNDPTYNLAIVLGSRYQVGNRHEKAYDYFLKAEEMAVDDENKHEALIHQALVLSAMGHKSESKNKALMASRIKPGDKRAYNLIGNLYFTSFEECKSGQSKVLDRAVFIAAHEMYKKAGNEEQMALTMEQFPSIEEIFNEGYEVGDKVTLDCWIGETVALDRRN